MQLRFKPMKKYMIAIVVAFSALIGLSVQAAPLAPTSTVVQTEVANESAVTSVYYRYGWRRYGWRRPYWRPYGVYGWRRPYWRPYGVYGWRRGWGWRGYGCRLRCNPWRCWRVCW